MDRRLIIASHLTATLLLGSCAGEPPPAEEPPLLQLWSDLASLVASPAAFGPHIRAVVEDALETAQAAPTNPSAVARLGMVLHAYDQFEGAERCYERALELQPGQSAWLYYLGSVRARLGRHNEALDAFRQAVRSDPSYAPARLQLADVLLATGAVEDSRALYDALTREHPSLVQAVYGLGRALSELHQNAAAVEQLARAIELAPEYGSAHYALGLAYRDLGDETAARRHVAESERTAGRQPPVDDPLMRNVHALRTDPRSREMRAFRLQLEGRVLESIEQYEQALANDSDLVQAHLNLIGLYTQTGQGDQAERHYRRVMSLNPNIADAHYSYAALQFQRGQQAESEADLLQALEINPAHYEARFSLGVLYEAQGRSGAAIRQHELALTHKPNGVGAHVRLGRLLLQQGEVTRGLASIEAGLAPESPETPVFMYELAGVHARLGQDEQAEHWFRRAHQLALQYDLQDLVAAIERELPSAR